MKYLALLFITLFIAYVRADLSPAIQTGHSQAVYASTVSPDGRLLATGGIDTNIVIFDLNSGLQLHSLTNHFSAIHDLAFSPDGRFLASSSSDGSVRFWHVETGNQVWILEEFQETTERYFQSVDFSVDGQHFLASFSIGLGPDAKSYVYVFEPTYEESSLKLFRPVKIYASGDGSFSANTAELIIRKPATFNVYSTESWEMTAQYPTGAGSIAPPEMNENYVFADGALYDRAGDRVITTFPSEASASFNPHNNTVLSLENDQLNFYETPFNRANKTLTGSMSDSGYSHVAYYSGVNAFLLGGDDGSVALRDKDTDSEIFHFESRVGVNVSADMHAKGRYLAVSLSSRQENYVAIWDLLTGKIVQRISDLGAGISEQVEHVIWEPGTDNLLILGGKDAGVLRVRNAMRQSESRLITTLESSPRSYALIGRKLAVGTYGGQVTVIDLDSSEIRGHWQFNQTAITGIDFVDENRLLALDMGGLIFDITLNTGTFDYWGAAVQFGSALRYIPNLGQIIVGSAFYAGTIGAVHDISTGELVKRLSVSTYQDFMPNVADIALIPDGQHLLLNIGDGSIVEFDTSSWQVTRTLSGHSDGPRSIRIVDQGQRFLSASFDGRTILWDVSSGTNIATFFTLNDNNSIVLRPDLSYLATPEANTGLAFRMGDRAYAFDQFDAQYNRPDKVLASLGKAPKSLIDAYSKASEKRRSYLGLRGQPAEESSSPLPEVSLQALAGGPVTQTQKIELEVVVKSFGHTIQGLDIWIDDVPITNRAEEIEVIPEGYLFRISLSLSTGRNDIKAQARTANGTRGLADNLAVTYMPGKIQKPDLYLIAVGSSEYQNQAFNLAYAAKDAEDVVEAFKQSTGDSYGNIKTLLLTDQQVTRENVFQVQEHISDARVDDVIIVMMAGHGLLSDDLEYYFATYDVDFLAPENRGLSIDDISGLFSDTQARRRVVMLDTCHAGEVDKEKTQVSQASPGVVDRSFRGLSIVENVDALYQGVSPFQLMLDAFADLRSDRGVTILSSSAGAEYAIESDELKNGVFTAQLLRAFDDPAADSNQDGAVRLSEVKEYAEQQVERATGGRQSVNFRVWNRYQDVVLSLQN